MSAGSQLAPHAADAALKGRSPLAHLLHALNQPLTGLQCSMELAVSGPRPTEQYVRVLREGLDLAARMRILVEAIRELVDIEQNDAGELEEIVLDALLAETVEDLRPVAEARGVRLVMKQDPNLAARLDRRWAASLLFRLLESAISLAAEASEFAIHSTRAKSEICIALAWTTGAIPEHSPLSPAELGLLIAQAGWERAGATWELQRAGNGQICRVRRPLKTSPARSKQHG
jgi:signal transduction histidine kinase